MRSLPFSPAWGRTSALAAVLCLGCEGVVNPEGQPPGSASSVGGASSTLGAGNSTSSAAGGPAGATATPGVGGSGGVGNAAGHGNGTPAAASGGAATPGGGATTSGPLGALSASYTRLTRNEYLATIASALGSAADATLIPVDGRIGPYTSNSAVSPDPVHPYLILAEDLARAVIPSKLPVCAGGSSAVCVRDDYRQPLERLYRRPLTDGELSGFATLVAELTEQGVSAEEATRAMLSAALISPDFLFRSAVSGSDEAADGGRLAERLSFALWDAPPDAELVVAASGASSERAEKLRGQAARLIGDARAVPVLARFLAQWLHVDTDLRLEDTAFEASPRYRELLAFVEDALTNGVAVSSLIAGDRGFVHRDNLAAYGLSSVDAPGAAAVLAVTWPADSPRRGILGEELFADATRHPDKSRRLIFRGRLVRTSLLCNPIPAPTPDLIALASEVGDRTVEPRCSGCHLLMDPIGRAFAALDIDDPSGGGPAEIRSHAELEGSYPNLPALLDAVATSRAFAECFASNWLGFLLEVPLSQVDPAWVERVADSVQAGADLGEIVERTISDLEAGASAAPPICGGP